MCVVWCMWTMMMTTAMLFGWIVIHTRNYTVCCTYMCAFPHWPTRRTIFKVDDIITFPLHVWLNSAKIGWIWGATRQKERTIGKYVVAVSAYVFVCVCESTAANDSMCQHWKHWNMNIRFHVLQQSIFLVVAPPFIHLLSSVHFPIWIKGKLCIFETSREKDRKLERKRNKERGWKWKRKRERKRQNNQISTLNGKWEIAFLTHSVLVKFTAFAVELMNEDNEDNAQNEMRFYSDEEKKENKYWKTIILHGIYEYKRTKDKMKCAAVKGRRQLLPLSQWMELYSLYV